MHWKHLLTDKRLGKTQSAKEHDRSAFQKDVDRIIFSSAFRRLQDKTQVFPLAKNDYVRTRLTHSLEVASVGRSLGTLVGKHIVQKHTDLTHITPEDIGSIVAAACLAHDIGNPPFGHFGEAAIRAFFTERPVGQAICQQLTPAQQADLTHFEGNAQGFRIVTRLQNPDIAGGLQLTQTTLGAFCKYPCTRAHYNPNNIATKKNGLIIADVPYFQAIANELGIIQTAAQAWVRHPLVYLMEAADDICYAIIDIEDAHQVKAVSYHDAIGLLQPLAGNYDHLRFQQMRSRSDQISFLRAKAIGNLLHQAVEAFIDNEDRLLAGNYPQSIVKAIPDHDALNALTQFAEKNIYNYPQVVETEMAGYRILGDLMEMFCSMIEDMAQHADNPSNAKAASNMLFNLLPTRFIGPERKIATCPYQRTLSIGDFVSGMTDSYAVSLHQKLTGIKL
ncbi:deoxyguanosinetriphosphate triphosphohydrolase [Cardiobacteriales bacterium ML27]|uniref:Deoxyguanosinetriphosphate triphosphohydrolase n=2 Tax=Ostreibacterium oceani TaxID=2654998 RepID=A0A6N7EYR7_9GAMM|nr:deoxyguanosinetriphosphate triphosphohydrolase [Ostreibacterium oceani]